MAADVRNTNASSSARSISVEDLLPSVAMTLPGVPDALLTSSIIDSVSSAIVRAMLSQPLKSTTSSRITEIRS